MFVKIMHYGSSDDDMVSERHIECHDVIMRYLSKSRVVFDILDNSQTVTQSIECHCSRTVIYYMSEAGKTIDSFNWREIEGVIKRM